MATREERESRQMMRKGQLNNRLDPNRYSRVQWQAEVSRSVYPSPDIRTRYQNATRGVSGAGYVYAGGSEMANYDIDEGELVFGFKSHPCRLNGNIGKYGAAYGWSSLNGIFLGSFGTAKHLADAIFTCGASKNQFNPADEAEGASKTGLATRCYGSDTIKNTLVENGYHGDPVLFYIPDPKNPHEVENYQHGALLLSPITKSKTTPVLKLYNSMEVKRSEVRLGLDAIRLNMKYPGTKYRELATDMHVDPDHQAAAELQHFIMGIVAAAVKDLCAQNLLVPNFRPDMTKKTSHADSFSYYDSMENVDPNAPTVEELLTGHTIYTSAPHDKLRELQDPKVRYGVDASKEQFAEMCTREQLFISNILGLSDGSVDPQHTVELRNDILKSVFSCNVEDTLYLPLLGGLLEAKDDNQRGTKKDWDELARYVKNISDIPFHLHNGFVYTNKVTCANIFGSAISTFVPGQQIVDVLYNGAKYKYA